MIIARSEPDAVDATIPLDEPPAHVIGYARSAFRDAITDNALVRPVYDAWGGRGGVRSRVLLFRGTGFALLLVCRPVPGGIRVGGAMFGGPTSCRVTVHRPGRPYLRLTTDSELRLEPRTLPHGLASIVTEYSSASGQHRWQSHWFRL